MHVSRPLEAGAECLPGLLPILPSETESLPDPGTYPFDLADLPREPQNPPASTLLVLGYR